jgi:hypothetical protein
MLELLGSISKWEFARRGIEEFLGRVASFHRVGLDLFPKANESAPAESCDSGAYQLPLHEPANDAASFRAILDRFDSMSPSGPAPTVPALEGALRHVEAVQKGTRIAQRVVLIVAGAPSDCGGTPDDLRVAFANSLVTSYVIALAPDFDVGPVGEATETWPFVLGEEQPSSRLADALWHATLGASRRACDHGRELPENVVIDRNASRMFFQNQEIPRLESAAQCDTSASGGFYLDEATQRPEYDFCPCTCARFTTCEAPELLMFCE